MNTEHDVHFPPFCPVSPYHHLSLYGLAFACVSSQRENLLYYKRSGARMMVLVQEASTTEGHPFMGGKVLDLHRGEKRCLLIRLIFSGKGDWVSE